MVKVELTLTSLKNELDQKSFKKGYKKLSRDIKEKTLKRRVFLNAFQIVNQPGLKSSFRTPKGPRYSRQKKLRSVIIQILFTLGR
jgi:hypothetical protein